MKKVLSVLLCMVMLLSSISVSASASEKVYNVTLDLSNKSPFGTFDGWGTSICWWGHHLGENLTEEQLDSVAKALYDEEEGLGLNIARYNIGGGDDPEHHHQREFDGRDMPGVLDKDGNWNLEKDLGQIKALQACVKYGADILEAFSNSPPYFMTESGCSSGNHNSGENNLPDDKFDDFAEFLAEAVMRIQNEYGVKFDTLEPFNESDTNYWGYEGWQEGCHFDVEDHSKLILLVREALDKRNLTDVGVAAADETNVWRTGENIKNVYTKEAINALSQVNTHSYSVGDYNYTRNAVLEAGKPLYMTEVDGDGSVGGEASGSMGPALWFANKISEDIRGLEPNAWVMWQATAMSYDGEHKDSGYWNIMSIDKETSEIHKTKKYYAYMQFTKFIRPGDTLVKTDYSNIVSAINEEEGKVVFVITNTDSAKKVYDFNLENLGMQIESVQTYETTKTRDFELAAVKETAKGIEVPAYSVVTVVVNGNVGNKSIRITEKNNTKTAFVGDVLEFEVKNEKGEVVEVKTQKCEEEGILTVEAEHEGLKDSCNATVVGNGSKVRIIGSGSERALKVSGSDVVIANRDNTPSQIWTIEKQTIMRSGEEPLELYAFRNEKTGKYLSTENFLTTSVLDEKAYWILEKDKGLFRIINSATGDSIDVYNHATHNGAQVGVYGGYYATPNQLFYFELAEPQTAVEIEYQASEIELTGTPFGTEPWDGDKNVTFDKAWDGDKETFFHAGRNDDRTGYTAIDLGEDHLPFNKVTINSRPGFEYRGWEAVLSGSNEKDGEYTVIHQFTEEDFQRGEYASVELDEYVSYRYVKYETPNGGYTNVGEVNLIYVPKRAEIELIDDALWVKGGRMKLISYYEDDVLVKTEVTKKSAFILKDNKYDIRIQALGSENNILGTFFIKKY
ncbi:MAG: RICIN domain-containing protein [Clostridia bacterium]|nr:RICIN domain-containing protein [Clostridia bacterium]